MGACCTLATQPSRMLWGGQHWCHLLYRKKQRYCAGIHVRGQQKPAISVTAACSTRSTRKLRSWPPVAVPDAMGWNRPGACIVNSASSDHPVQERWIG